MDFTFCTYLIQFLKIIFRHYVLNVLWIFINVLCVLLTMYHLYKLYKDLSRSNLEAVRVATLVTTMISVQSPHHGNGTTHNGQGPEGDPLGANGALAPNSVNSRIGKSIINTMK